MININSLVEYKQNNIDIESSISSINNCLKREHEEIEKENKHIHQAMISVLFSYPFAKKQELILRTLTALNAPIEIYPVLKQRVTAYISNHRTR
jgi:hypothetical protein